MEKIGRTDDYPQFTTKTLKASPLSNRGVRSTPRCRMAPASTLEGSPACSWGTPPECTAAGMSTCRGCSLRSYPRLPSEDRVAVSLVVTLCALRELHLELCGEKKHRPAGWIKRIKRI